MDHPHGAICWSAIVTFLCYSNSFVSVMRTIKHVATSYYDQSEIRFARSQDLVSRGNDIISRGNVV